MLADGRPEWVPLLSDRLASYQADVAAPPPVDARRAAVLVLLIAEPDEYAPTVLVLERAGTMRTHAGQMAFPGGAVDATDDTAAATALRETDEEIGVLPSSVEVLGELPAVWVAPSNYVVVPVIAWWREPHPLPAHNAGEVAHVRRISLGVLAQPTNRYRVRLTPELTGPAFQIDADVIWGFTGGVLAVLLSLGGWAQPWDRARFLPRPH